MKELLNSVISWGPTGLLLISFLDGAGLPIPGGVDALVVFLASRRPFDAWWLALITVAGSTCGNFILFLLARRGGKTFLDKRSGRRSARFRRWFDRYGLLTVFISALVPLPVMPMKIFVLCSGALGSKVSGFLVSFVSARFARYFGLAHLGRSMGDDALGYLRDHAWQLTVFAFALFLILMLMIKIIDRRAASRFHATY